MISPLGTSLATVHQFAKQMFLARGNHPMMVLVATDTEFTHFAPEFDTEEDKGRFVIAMKALIRDLDVIEYFIICESWSRVASSVEECEYIDENWDTESPSCYPPSMCTEMLLTIHATKDGVIESLVSEINRGDGTLTLTDLDLDKNSAGGVFATLFQA